MGNGRNDGPPGKLHAEVQIRGHTDIEAMRRTDARIPRFARLPIK